MSTKLTTKTDIVSSIPAVLCLTENRAFQNRVRNSLGDSGFSVVTCRAADEALELVTAARFDVLIIDQSLSNDDGLSVWKRVCITAPLTPPAALIASECYNAAFLSQVVAAEVAGIILSSARGEEIVEQVLGVMTDPSRRKIIEDMLGERVLDGGIDSVTRIANTSHFSRRLAGESVAAYREGSHLSVLIVSVDQFYVLARRHGPKMTDDLLAHVARVIQGDLRSRDCVARYSEKSFGVILSGVELHAATAVGRRLMQAIERTEFGRLDQPIAITVSVGVACRPIGTKSSTDEIIGHALKSCVAAEQMGGGRVVTDRFLTGQPLALVYCTDAEKVAEMSLLLSASDLEVRGVESIDSARKQMAAIPVSMLLAVGPGRDAAEALDLLSWAARKHPATRRVLVASKVDLYTAMLAVNNASVHWLLGIPWDEDSLCEAVGKLIYK